MLKIALLFKMGLSFYHIALKMLELKESGSPESSLAVCGCKEEVWLY